MVRDGLRLALLKNIKMILAEHMFCFLIKWFCFKKFILFSKSFKNFKQQLFWSINIINFVQYTYFKVDFISVLILLYILYILSIRYIER